MGPLISLFLLLVPMFCLPAATLANNPPNRLESVEASFHQEKHLPILTRPIVSEGTFSFQAPQSLRWAYQTPVRSVLLMHGGQVRKFVDRDGQLREEPGMGMDAMQVVLAEIGNWLDGRFSDNRMFSVSLPDARTVTLTPKEPGMAALISRIELQLADTAGLLDAVTIFEGEDAWTRLTFSDRILNHPIPAQRFTEP